MKARVSWREQREKRAFLALEDGTVFRGYSVGAPRDTLGEVVFNTGMTGYQEILSDPSYAGQIVTMTYTELGNTGVNSQDMESRRSWANGFITHEVREQSNWRAESSLADWLVATGTPAMAGVDTRELTILIREKGSLKAFMCVTGTVSEEEAIARARRWEGLDCQDYACRVTCSKPFRWDEDGKLTASWGIADSLPQPMLHVVVYDFGVKWNILRSLRRLGMAVTVVPARTPAEAVLQMKPDGVVFSNGPADPAALTYAVEAARSLVGRIPLLGICLGHQLFGLALGARTYRLKFGHHGCNHPVKDLATGAVEITSQNHNFAVDPATLPADDVEVTHLNLNDGTVEGLRHRHEPMFSVQYHPEAAPGPHDASHLFIRFRNMMAGE